MDYVTQLRNEFATLHTAAGAILTAAATAKRDTTADEKASNELRYSRMEAIQATIAEQTRFAKLALDNGTAVMPVVPPGQPEFENNANFSKADGQLDIVAIRKAINHFARTGETRQLFTVTSTTGSGAYLPTEVLQPISVRRLQNSFRSLIESYGIVAMVVPNTANFSLPVADDTANVGQAQSEASTTGTELDPADASLLIAPTLYSSKQFWYSNTMANSGAFDLLAFVLPMAQKRIDKIQETAWTNLVKAQTNGKTTASPAGITYSELLDWEHSLAPAYRADAGFIVSDALYRSLRGLVDGNARPILDLDPTNKFVGTIHGKPVIVNDYLDGFGAVSRKLGFFASASAVQIVDVADARVIRYVNVPAKVDQVGFEQVVNGDMKFVGKGVSVIGT